MNIKPGLIFFHNYNAYCFYENILFHIQDESKAAVKLKLQERSELEFESCTVQIYWGKEEATQSY